MEFVEIEINKLVNASWNANIMQPSMLEKLRESVYRYGVIENFVVRPIANGKFEVVGGNWRLQILAELRFDVAPCVIVDVDDADARLLAQALNRIEGTDDIGLRAQLVKKVLESIPQDEVLRILPETAESLKALASMGQEDMAVYLQRWQQAQSARLRHMQFQFTEDELSVVEQALKVSLRQVKEKTDNPNLRGRALVAICEKYLKSKHLYAAYRGRTS